MDNITKQNFMIFNKVQGANIPSGWYIHLPQWQGKKEDLQMVSGADAFLEFLAGGEMSVSLEIADNLGDGRYENPGEWLTVDRIAFGDEGNLFAEGGAFYVVRGINHMMWLCDVTKFVFGGTFPKRIYIRKI